MRTLVLVLVALSCACAASTPPAASPATQSPATPLKAPGEAQIGDRTTCPVSHDEFVVKADSPQVTYEGKTYYFCCKGCTGKFKADPKKYLLAPGA